MRFRRSKPQTAKRSPKDLIHEAQERLNQAAVELRTDAETSRLFDEVEVRVGALESWVEAHDARGELA